MRILKLTPRTERWLLARRAQRDDEAQSVAAEIVADVRRRGDSALFAWSKKLDDLDLSRAGVWISREEIRSAKAQVSPDFLKAIRSAAKNVRQVAEQQLPRPWTTETGPGVKISQRVSPIVSVGCYIPGRRFSLLFTLFMPAVPADAGGGPHIAAVCPRPKPELPATASPRD